jgi:hypothetical protein
MGQVDAMTYRMNPGHPLALPDADYLDLIMQGYEEWDIDMDMLKDLSEWRTA